jgi:C1A family cysteine protease
MSDPIRHFGAHRDKPDARDHAYVAPAALLKQRPARVDLRPQCPPVYDQRPLQSCTANAAAAAIQFERRRRGLQPDFIPSRLFIYYNERTLLGTADQDAGAPLREAIKALVKQGDCPEEHWPYDHAKVNVAPPERCYQDAVRYKQVAYKRLPQDLAQLQACLASGRPFLLAFAVYESFETPEAARAGAPPLPKPGEKLLGNHAVMAVGYDDAHRRFIVRNSWGPQWGDAGYFGLSYDYAVDPKLAGDFWTLEIAAV